MSEDIDFKEIDDLMAAMSDDAQAKKSIAAEVSADQPVIKKKASEPKAKPTAKAKPTTKTKPAPKTDGEVVDVKVNSKSAPEPEAELEVEFKPNPKTGHYMDLVHPMSDMATTERPDRKAPPVVIVKTVAAGAISLVSPDATSDINDPPADEVLVDEPQEPKDDDDDILDDIIGEVDAIVDAAAADESDDLDRLADELSYGDLETPFLENVKVEKRPLGGGELEEREIRLKELAEAEENRTINQAKEEAADEDFISDKNHTNWASDPKKQPETPPKQPAKKKTHGALSVFLYILLIVLLVILGGAIGVLAYFSGLFEGLI